jgi:2-aminoadipate transaminase
LKDKLDTMVEAVEREFGTAVEPWVPKGGIFLWMKLPDEVDVRKLVQPALKAGIAFNPGPEWAVDGDAAKSRLRLCFGLTTKEEIREGVAAFARVCHEETGIPEQSGNVRHAAPRPGG